MPNVCDETAEDKTEGHAEQRREGCNEATVNNAQINCFDAWYILPRLSSNSKKRIKRRQK
jgi:hypothetical protein